MYLSFLAIIFHSFLYYPEPLQVPLTPSNQLIYLIIPKVLPISSTNPSPLFLYPPYILYTDPT
ncbi:unnamed protein product [Meloidogyne enterolobii]|uniref:Uncharacterized protein n=1 Tax=Meloidogyne enterolobii TaxID=390850 RepID=A0ACB1A7Z0_MELEN